MQILENNNVIADEYAIARLSEGLIDTNIISEVAIIRAEQIMRNYSDICDKHNVDVIIARGTSAFREANNRVEVVSRLEKCFVKKHCKIKTITARKEAEYSFIGAISDINCSEYKTLVDIGGGSTEITSGTINNINYTISIPIGVVKLIEMFAIRQPISDSKEIREYIKEQLSIVEINKCMGDLIAVSGTPTAMAGITLGIDEYDREKINNYVFDIETLHKTANLIYSCSLTDLIDNYKIVPQRADVLSAGVMILEEVIDMLNRNKLIVNVNGLRTGAAIKYLLKHKSGKVHL